MAWFRWDDFDKRMCGIWVGERFEVGNKSIRIFLNIEQTQEGVVVQYDFDGCFFYKYASYVEYSNNELYFFHDSRRQRAEYALAVADDDTDSHSKSWSALCQNAPCGGAELPSAHHVLKWNQYDLLKCKFSINNSWGHDGKFEKDIEFVRLDKLSDDEYNDLFGKSVVRLKGISRLALLKEYAEYGDVKMTAEFTYKFDEQENMLDIIGKHGLNELVKDKSDVETAIALMNWLCKSYKHGNPPDDLPVPSTPQNLMEAADNNEGRTNCRGLSLILAQLIRAFGIKAYHVTCMPYEKPFHDCHVVVSVYCESLKKCIMLDPTYNLYLTYKNGDILSIEELRDISVCGGKVLVFANTDADIWEWERRATALDEYKVYMAENLIRMSRCVVNGYGIDERDNRVELIPEKYMQNEAKLFDEVEQKSFITSRECFWSR